MQPLITSLNESMPYPWRKVKHNDIMFATAGNPTEKLLDTVVDYVQGNTDAHKIEKTLNETYYHFAIIAEGRKRVFAAVDAVRSYPLFYSCNAGNPAIIALAPRSIIKNLGNNPNVNNDSLMELFFSGYTAENKTIFNEICQLQSGEYLTVDFSSQTVSISQYYEYLPAEPDKILDFDVYCAQLEDVLNSVFERLLNILDGRPVWIPLSGGLDSTLIVAKLHEMGYGKNLRTFSYGPKNNTQAVIAKMTAETLNIPWMFIKPIFRHKACEFFQSDLRREYWKFADGLSATPFMQDFHALYYLKNHNIIPDDAVIINGQSGDFISGAHIPLQILISENNNACHEYILKKHFSLWNLKNSSFSVEMLEEIFISRKKFAELSIEEKAAVYERFEWQYRQSRFVVNGQRCYDFFHLDWKLPLWDKEYMDFWKTVPLEFRAGQKLLKKYLKEKYDYKGLFSRKLPEGAVFPGIFGPFVGKVADFCEMMNSNAVALTALFSHYSDYYKFYPLKECLNLLPKTTTPPYSRGVVAINTLKWFEENGLDLPVDDLRV